MLKILSALIIALSFYSCNETEPQTAEVEANIPNIDSTKENILHLSEIWSEYVEDDSVQIKLSIDQKKESIITEIELFGGAWIVSPLAINYPFGKMELSLEENDIISLNSEITQTPDGNIVSDSNTDENYGIIQNTSVIEQKLNLASEDDFEVKGELFYLLEPMCLPFRIDFTLGSKNSELSIQADEEFAIPTN